MKYEIIRSLNPFRILAFRRIIFAAFVSGVGDAITPIAFAIESHRIEPSGWGFSVVLISLWSGRFLGVNITRRMKPSKNPITVMIKSDIIRMFAQAGLLVWIMVYENHINNDELLIAAFSISSFVYGISTAFFIPAKFSSISVLIPIDNHKDANSWLSMMGDTLSIIGPLFGSLIFIYLGFKSILFIDSTSFLLSIILLLGLVSNPDKSAFRFFVSPAEKEKEGNLSAFNTKLPAWVNAGMFTWLITSSIIGMLGVSGPTFILEKNSVTVWAITAAFMATGSLFGSSSTLLFKKLEILPWKYLQMMSCFGLSIELLSFSYSPMPAIIWLSAFIGSALVSISGIRWDTLGQSMGSNSEVHAFAVLDQTVNTIGVPAGMLLFGLSSAFGTTSGAVIAIVGVVVATGLIVATMKISWPSKLTQS